MNNPHPLDNIFVGNLRGTLQGPVVSSQQFDPQLFTYMNVYEWEVHNGFKIDIPATFGVFCEVIQLNINKSKVRLRLAPGFPTAPTFARVCAKESPVEGPIYYSTICRQVVPIGTVPESGAGIWDSVVQPIDEVHGLLVTRGQTSLFTNQSYVVSRPLTTPERFRAATTTIDETHIEYGTATQPTLDVGDIQRSEEQNTALTKIVNHRYVDLTITPTLSGSLAYAERVFATIQETLMTSNTPADTGLQIIESSVEANGDGTWTKKTVQNPDEWPVHVGSEWDPELQTQVKFTEQFVSPPDSAALLEPYTSFKIVNKDRSLKRVAVEPTETLENYVLSYPVPINIDLPRELIAVHVVWNVSVAQGSQDSSWSGYSVGTSWSLSANMNDSANGSASFQPDVQLTFKDYLGRNLIGEAHVFYMPLPITTKRILARLQQITKQTVRTWPIFQLRSTTITAVGQNVSLKVNAQVNAHSSGSASTNSQDAGQSTSDEFSVSMVNQSIQIPSCIHKRISFTGGTERSALLYATANIGVVGKNFPTISAARSRAIPVKGFVSPNELPASSDGKRSIPVEGLYLMGVPKVQVTDWGHAKVYAEIFDASKLK